MSAYTALLEDLASHGYVVLCIGHPNEVVAMRLADGTFASLLDSADNMNGEVRDVIAEWADEDSTLARAPRARCGRATGDPARVHTRRAEDERGRRAMGAGHSLCAGALCEAATQHAR